MVRLFAFSLETSIAAMDASLDECRYEADRGYWAFLLEYLDQTFLWPESSLAAITIGYKSENAPHKALAAGTKVSVSYKSLFSLLAVLQNTRYEGLSWHWVRYKQFFPWPTRRG